MASALDAPSPTEIRRNREALALSQEQLARRLGVSFATVNRWERGRTRPRGPALSRLRSIRTLGARTALGTASAAGVEDDLPRFGSAFVGRQGDMERVRTCLKQSRLCTMVGPAGCGKTRLAIEAVRSDLVSWAGRATFVTLEPARTEAEVAGVLLGHAGGGTGGGPMEDDIAAALAGTRLLILDNCEHVQADVGHLAVALLMRCPDLSILATSRRPLQCPGEAVLRLGPLPVGDGGTGTDAVALLLDRIARRDPTAGATAIDRREAIEICRRLDGLPLAVELAAGWVASGRLGLVEEWLEEEGGTGPGRSTGSAPSASLAGAVARSYDLLGPSQRALFERLSIIPGTFGLDLAEQMAGDDDEAASDGMLDLAALVETSMVEVRPGPREPRYVLLGTLRRFGRRRLAAGDRAGPAWARLHAWSLGFARRSHAGMAGGDQAGWIARAASEAETVNLSLSWAIDRGDASLAVPLAAAFWWFWHARSDVVRGLGLIEAALRLPGSVEARDRNEALLGAGVLARQRGDYSRAVGHLREHLALCRELGDEAAVAGAHSNLAGALHGTGDSGRAREMLLASLDWWERLRDRRGLASALSNLGVLASDTGDLVAAREYGEQALAIRLAGSFPDGIAISYDNLATVALRAGDDVRARRLFREALLRYSALGEPDGIATALEGLAAVLEPSDAIRLAAAAARLRTEIGVPPWRLGATLHDKRLAMLRGAVGVRAYDEAWRSGETLDVTAATALALHVTAADAAIPAAEGLMRRLSPREREVLALVVDGHTTKEIAYRLGLSPRSVDRHLANVYSKIGARGRADAIAFGLRLAATEPAGSWSPGDAPALGIHSERPVTADGRALDHGGHAVEQLFAVHPPPTEDTHGPPEATGSDQAGPRHPASSA